MSESVDRPERETQERIIKLFQKLGYAYLGDRADRPDNSNIEEAELTAWLTTQGYSSAAIGSAIFKLKAAAHAPDRDLYHANHDVYQFLRYGVGVVSEPSKPEQTLWLIDWAHPENNDFAVAEEVTLKGDHDRRPDLVLYVNGIALGVIELKRSSVSIGEGIRQNLSNQKVEFGHPWFFSTIQYVFAGNNSAGLQYGTIETPQKLFLKWKEDEADNAGYKLDKYLAKMCEKSRFLEVIQDFVVFDAGWKKLPRAHQYFAIKRAQEHVDASKGGIIWHTQGGGKSIVMVLLAKWLLEHDPDGRVLVVTDRDELDKQIERVFKDIGEQITRTSSGDELLTLLAAAKPRLICSLIHKFGPRGELDFEQYLKALKSQAVPPAGNFYVFVDEAHRSQGGKFHAALKGILPDAIFIGFTGTPLLKADADSRRVFGGYIHTYKVNEAEADGVILPITYEAFNVDQRLSSEDQVNKYFEAKAKGLNSWQRQELQKRWATKQKVLSAKSRLEKIVNHIVLDFETRPRLESNEGNAMLVASNIPDACRYYELFQNTELRGKCAIITSHGHNIGEQKLEDTGESPTDKQRVYETYEKLLKDVQPKGGKDKLETYEDDAKDRFIKEPDKMKLLIVVNKLLTGFDAPPCSVLYIDKHMQDHGLFQAICRTNRIDDKSPSKEFGTVVDYKGLFRQVQGAMEVYSSELEPEMPGDDPEILIKTRAELARELLEEAKEALLFLEEPVPMPRTDLQYQHYFCGNTEIESDLDAKAYLREALYRSVATFVRAIANVGEDWDASGYAQPEIDAILALQKHFLKVRDLVRLTSGEQLDLKPYKADMRRLIDMYVEADPAREIFSTHDMGVLEMLDQLGAAETMKRIGERTVSAEVVENNIRKTIVKSKLSDPVYYETMSELLNQVIADRKAGAIEYAEYLKRIEDLAKNAKSERLDDTPSTLDTPGKRALWNNLGKNAALALALDATIREHRPDAWRGNPQKENVIRKAIYETLKADGVSYQTDEVERVFNIVREQAEYR